MNKILQFAKARKIGTLPLIIHRGKAYLPQDISPTGSPLRRSKVTLCNWPRSKGESIRLALTSRYLAQTHSDVAFVNLRYAAKLPNWPAPFGALPELANAMERAGLLN